ncbi:hypothetical protein MARI151_10132 [Maribacter litoralis]|uniref:Uncharacterized protein n=1 Tax=Maribacter litoralis TaxID=2059726 RepID=A0A653LUT9_9FLAO|nr:hypothetical protein MARI151_10132 [Maribacter litoralis]
MVHDIRQLLKSYSELRILVHTQRILKGTHFTSSSQLDLTLNSNNLKLRS